MSKNVKCPKCKSVNIQVMGSSKKGFSTTKAIIGYGLTALNPLGLAAGIIGNKGKYDVFCGDCGHRFKVK